MTRILFGILATLLLAAGCGQETAKPAPTVTPTVTTTPASAPPTTDRIKALLKGLPIDAYTVYTAETDTNHLLGRPSQYIAKLSWHDSRIQDRPLEPNALSVDDGGGVEIFARAADRDTRLGYITTIAKQPLFAEYDYPIGTYTLLRISRKLTPQQAAEYQQVLASLA